MDVLSFIRPELLIVAVVLYLIGYGLKKCNKIKDNFIPIILGVSGIVICTIYIFIFDGFVWQSLISGIIQGILVASASTYVNQVIKQMKKLGVNEKLTEIAETIVENTQEKNQDK